MDFLKFVFLLYVFTLHKKTWNHLFFETVDKYLTVLLTTADKSSEACNSIYLLEVKV